MVDSRQQAYELILRRAIPLANKRLSSIPGMTDLLGMYKLPNSYERLEIHYDVSYLESTIQGMIKHRRETRSADEIHAIFVQTAREGVQEALRFEPEAIGYLMLENIRNAATARTNGSL